MAEQNYFELVEGPDKIWELVFDVPGVGYNTFSQAALKELADVVDALTERSDIDGLIVRSAKDSFCVGMDISEFPGMFEMKQSEIEQKVAQGQSIFIRLEDLGYPTVTLINGAALGGGFEFCLATDFRLVTADANVGLPETRLGLCPGWGGSVRLPRIVGLDNAIEWICSGQELSAQEAVAAGIAEAIVPSEKMLQAGHDLISEVVSGKRDYLSKRQHKLDAVQLSGTELDMVFRTSVPMVAASAGSHYPAPRKILESMQQGVTEARAAAHESEAACFAELAKTNAAATLCAVFLNGQYADRQARSLAAEAPVPTKAAVVGAGIMGGGIAHRSVMKGIPVLMKDISEGALATGMSTALDLVDSGIKRGRATAKDRKKIAIGIRPTMGFDGFDSVDIVIEAVVEDAAIKARVLADCESNIRDDAILTSNTSTLSITNLASNLSRPEQFCGMHFFNPVHRMPLVEIVRGAETSAETIQAVTKYALALGKKPIVVNDCPGFLVNRIIVPYTLGFTLLLNEGVDFERIDRVMEKFGWPMGPAALADLVGLDTGENVSAVMAAGYPDRMDLRGESTRSLLAADGRLGRKSGGGFYDYVNDKKGKLRKVSSPQVHNILRKAFEGNADVRDDEIIERMMIPLCIEAGRCIEDEIVGSPQELDSALVMGIGFPPFLGGALCYIDTIGPGGFVELASQYASLGPLYQPGADLLARSERNGHFFNSSKSKA